MSTEKSGDESGSLFAAPSAPNPGGESDESVYMDASLLRRFFARWLDYFVYSATQQGTLYAVMFFTGGWELLVAGDLDAAYDLNPMAVFAALGVTGLAFVLNMVLLAKTGQTVGKRVLGIIVQADEGGLAGANRAVFRREVATGLMCMVPGVGLLFWIGNYAVLLNGKHRTLHDSFARTRVLRAVKL